MLTPRQLEVLCLYASGMKQPEVASLLGLQPKTVENHLEQIRHRLGTRSVCQSVVVALAREMLVVDRSSESTKIPDRRLMAA